jgi:hypothetical protein
VGLFSKGPDSGSGDDDAGGEGTSFWQERGFVASAIVVGAVVVCLLVWFFARDTGTPTTQPTDSPSTVVPTEQPTEESSVPATPTEQPTGTTTPSSGPTASGPGGCRLKHPDQTIPRVAPLAVTWQFEADMLIPLQQEGGPAVTDRTGVRSCFAHSPTGAVLAAMVLLGQIRNPQLTDYVLAKRVVPGPGRNRAAVEAQTITTPRNLGQVPQFTGFKVIDYLPNRAIMSIAVQVDDRNVAALLVTMAWSGGDWKAVLQDDGSFNGAVAPEVLQSLDGFVGFRGA